MARRGLYKGYSSFEFEKSKNFQLTDIDLVKMDLLNHIFTRRGERPMMPTFGTSIPDLTFEPLDDDTLGILEDEINLVFSYDPRVEVLELKLDPQYDENAVMMYARIRYIEINQVDVLNLRFNFGQQGI